MEIEAPISGEMLIKYIAYARTNVYPVTSQEVWKYIQNFYLDIRNMKSIDPRSPVPITARCLEALQRLSEARARMRLSDIVSIENIEFVKSVLFVKSVFIVSLKHVGIYVETGKLDAGIVNCGKSQSQAKKIKLLTVS